MNIVDIIVFDWLVIVVLNVVSIGDIYFFLVWLFVMDDLGVASYCVMYNDVVFVMVDGATYCDVIGLMLWIDYILYLIAIDEVGNLFLFGFIVFVMMLDWEVLMWFVGVVLNVDIVDEFSVIFLWTVVQDNVGISVYELCWDKVVI